jgi:hypothetical protein
MQGLPRSYRSIEEFEREEIRPGLRIGFTLDDLEEGSFEVGMGLDGDREDDPFERQSRTQESERAARDTGARTSTRRRRTATL